MDHTTRQQLNQCRRQYILPSSTCDAIEDGTIECFSAEIALEALEDNEDLYDLYNYISVNFS
jgi:hypothetical protein